MLCLVQSNSYWHDIIFLVCAGQWTMQSLYCDLESQRARRYTQNKIHIKMLPFPGEIVVYKFNWSIESVKKNIVLHFAKYFHRLLLSSIKFINSSCFYTFPSSIPFLLFILTKNQIYMYFNLCLSFYFYFFIEK